MSVRALKGKASDGGFIIGKNIHITKRELEALSFIGRGLDNNEVANILGVSVNTVRNHIYNVMKKLNAESRANAIVKAVENEMIVIERDKDLVGWESSDYLLCAICGRAFLRDNLRVIEQEPTVINHIKYEMPDEVLCGYQDCQGTLGLTMKWDNVRKLRPEYPEIPEEGVIYEYELDWVINGL